MLGLLGLRIFEDTGADIGDLGEEHGHRVLRVCGKGSKVVLVPLPPAVGRAIDRAAGARTAGRSCSIIAVRGWTGMPLPGGSGGSQRRRACGSPDFPDRVVDGAAGPGLVRGHRGHDGRAGRRHHQSHAAPMIATARASAG